MRRFLCFSIAALFLFSVSVLAGIYQFKMPKIKGMPNKAKIVLTTFRGEIIPGLRSITEDFKKLTGISVEIAAVDQLRFPDWLKCQFISEDPPAVILNEFTTGGQDLSIVYGTAGMLVKFDNYLNIPNPFNPEDKRWFDDFSSNLMTESIDKQSGHYFCLPYTKFVVGFFYNKDKYKKYGLTPPKTWAEFMHNCKVIKNHGDTALITSLVYGDAQNIWWVPSLLMKPLFLSRIPEVNLIHKPGWKYDVNNKKTIEGERIEVSERIVAFKKGIIDPLKSPEYREFARLMKEFSKLWRDDFMSVDGTRLYKYFAQGQSVHFMNGTWFLPILADLQKSLSKISPESDFEWGVFPFPELTSASTDIPILASIQNQGLRATLMVTKNKKEPWREKAGVLFVQYITSPKIAQKILDKSILYDISAIVGVEPKPEIKPFMGNKEYAEISLASYSGWDGLSTELYVKTWLAFLSGKITMDEYLKESSKFQWESLMRRAIEEKRRGTLKTEFIKKELGEKELKEILRDAN